MYGANQSLLCMIDGLKKYDIKPYVISPSEGPITEMSEQKGIPYRVLPFKRWMSRNRWKSPARLMANLMVLPILIKQIKDWQIDLVYTNDSEIPAGAFAAKLLALPHVWHIREFGYLDFGLSYDWGKPFFEKWIQRADVIIAVSEAVRHEVLANAANPVCVIYDPVMGAQALKRLQNINRSPDKNKPNVALTFAIVGRVQPPKGQEQAIRALHKVRLDGYNVRLLVAGEGENQFMNFLHELCESLGVRDAVSFLGHVAKPFEVYQSADVILMCSPHEAFGRVTVEAMAAARPVIGYAAGGTPELIKDDYNGLLYDGSVDDLSDSMKKLLNNPEKIVSMGLKGQDMVKSFTNENHAAEIYKIVQKVMRETGNKKDKQQKYVKSGITSFH